MTEFNLQRATLQQLQDCARAGLTHLPSVEIQSKEEPMGDQNVVTKTVGHDDANQEGAKPMGQVDAEMPKDEQLADLADQVAQCAKCQELADTRTQTVFGVGNSNAQVMFIGEAPGADEDRQGEPFVGRAGKLLTKIIEACGWQRSEIYICNILRCRPPENRNPTSEEAANCREFLDAQIEIVDPDYIVCWGSVAAKNLLDVETSIGKLRGHFYSYGRAQVLCTYHPSYLLRNPSAKKPVWDDMKLLLGEMGLTPPNESSN